MKVAALLAIALGGAVPAAAQSVPFIGPADPRVQLVDYRADHVIRIEAAIGYQVTVELAPDEQIQTVSVGDSATWQATANKAGNRLFVKPTQAGGPTNMIVVTNSRSYNFELVVGNDGSAFVVRFRYPLDTPSQPLTSREVAGNYRLKGDKRLWPDSMHDDGAKTFIDWPPDVALPAVYIIDGLGREMLANGNVRDGIFVIDEVERELIFRIDHHVARALRYVPKKQKQ